MKNVINTKEGSNEETKVEKLDGTHVKDKYGRLKPTHILVFSSFFFYGVKCGILYMYMCILLNI